VVGNLSPDLVVRCLKPVRSTLTSDTGMLSNDSLEGIKDSRARGNNGSALECGIPILFGL